MDVQRGTTTTKTSQQEHGRQQNKDKGLRDRAWRDAQASSNRDQGNTARKKREAAALDA